MANRDPEQEFQYKKRELLKSQLTNKQLRERIKLLKKMQKNKSRIIGPI